MTDFSDNGLSGLSDDDANQNVKIRMSNHTNARRSTDFNRTSSNTEHHNHKHGGALQQLSSLLGQTMRLENVADLKGSLPTIPINDLRGEEAAAYHREDCVLRRSLAALYRLIDMRGWTHSIYNHISARCTTNPNQFLINPFGLLYHEIQASSLVKVDASGNIIDQGSSVLGVNKAGWTLHSALHSARKDVNCIIHVHLPDVIAVSCLRAGLLPVSPEAIELISNHGVRYHEYRGILVDEAEHSSIVKDLGSKAKVLFLRNHGVAVAASNIPEAWYLVKRVITACQTQMRLMQLSDVASLLSDLKDNGMQLTDGPADQSEKEESDAVDRDKNDHASLSNGKANSDSGDISWTPAELEFEAEMRVLDSAGFRTGHVYRQPNLLRRTHPGSTWPGDTYGDQTTGADLLTTDFSTNEFSGVEDIAAAEAAGAEQVAKIMDHVRASRQKNVQRNQWLAKANEPSQNGMVTSSMIASPQELSKTKCSADYHSHPFTPDSLMCSPVLRSEPERTSQIGRDFHSSVTRSPLDVSDYSVHNGSVSTSLNTSPSNSLTPKKLFNDSSVNKSATLPANVQHMSVMSNSNTLQSVDGDLLNTNAEESRTLEKKIKKKGSFRMPSFSRKKKH
ncbi:hypothetical protein MN116_003793 [Schistosoma mekongi]|uniref:Class II aldolase/adducin N-terminal domain-containing protein n=1 Tax=Schistosoma mekongi TaxID=38744 RepID=A0AAE1ZDZ4_SCHME|nr:hypothetical protein MN116_003793 [Schistosoma mekongi]